MDRRQPKTGTFEAAKIAVDYAYARRAQRDSSRTSSAEEPKERASTEVKRSTSRSMPKYSTSQLSPSLAAAMLSMPWPPPSPVPPCPDNSKTEFGVAEESAHGSKFGTTKPASKKPSRKLASKSKSVSTDRDNNNEESQEYLPFRIPKFHEVHTNWPGFEHQPIPNWQEKYMIAKPYQKRYEELPQGKVLSQPSYSNLASNGRDYDSNNVAPLTPLRSAEKSKHTRSRSKTEGMPATKNKPRARVHVERVGSCIR